MCIHFSISNYDAEFFSVAQAQEYLFTSNKNLKMELRSHKRTCILSYSIFPEYSFWFFVDILTETSIEKNTPFYRPSDHFIVDQINNITDVYY